MKSTIVRAALLAALLSYTAFLAGCGALSAMSSAASPDAGAGVLVVNEIVSSNKRSLVDGVVGTPDWIELYNAGGAAIDLSGHGVSDNMRDLHRYVFPSGTTLGAGEYLILYATDAPDAAGANAACLGFGLSKSGDYLFITDAYYGLIAQMEIPALYTDVSYARAGDGSFGYCASTTPGAANSAEIYPSLAAVFAAQNLDALALSEVMPNADASGYKWVELKNNGASAMRLENFCLSDDDANPLKWQFPSASIAAGGHVCVYLSGLDTDASDGIHTSFRLGRADVYLVLSDLQGNVIDRLEWQGGVPAGVSVVRGEGGAAYTAFPTFEAENSADTFTNLTTTAMDASDPIHISEVLKYNTLSAVDADGDRSEWVELRNYSSGALSLHGYFLSDDGEDLYKWALPDIGLEAGGYLVVFLSGKNRTQGELHASFGLSDEENEVFLTCLDGMRTEAISLAGVTKSNVSVGLDDRLNIRYYAMPTPGYRNAQGFETADQIGCFDQHGVFISEVSAVQAAKSGKNDWIELHNGGEAAVDLTGWHLSDDPVEPAKFRIEGVTIAAGGYAVIEATSHVTRQTGGVAPFGISPAGETLVLTNALGELADSFDTGALSVDVTSGRVENDPTIARAFFGKATRGKKNDSNISVGVSSQPVFSETSLYHTSAFTVTISCPDPNATIYYTTNGDEPTYRSHAYTGPVKISRSAPLRAVSYSAGKRASAITTATYLFEKPHAVPVVCVTGNPERIYEVMSVNHQRDKVERLATISYYETDGTFGTEFPAGIKPKGAGTVVYPQKSLSINLRGGYGQGSVTYPFWPGYGFTTFSALVVRNGGQDYDEARIRDAYASALVEGMYLDNSATRPVVVYINGSYNGLYDLGEDQNAEFLSTHYGIDADTVDFIRRNQQVIKGGNADIRRVRTFALDKDLANDETFAQFVEWIDVAYFTDYFIAQTYMGNTDMFNQKYWRTQDYALKWRPVFYDLDFAFKSATWDIIGEYFNKAGVPSRDETRTYFEIYIGLCKNAAWREYCVERYVEVVQTYFNSARALRLFDEMVAAMRPEMARHVAKWGKPSSMQKWENEIASMRRVIERRPENALESMRKYFGVSRARLDELIAKYPAG